MFKYAFVILFIAMISACENAPKQTQENNTSQNTALETSQPPKGKKLFIQHCSSCHAINNAVVGPALKDVHQRRELEWLVQFTKNSSQMIEKGDKDAVAVYEEYNKIAMTSFENILTDEEIKAIFSYIEEASK